MVRAKDVKAEAMRLGFDAAGVCEAAPAEHHGALLAWVRDGLHGTMAYMDRHAALRSDPRLLLEGARSIVAVAQHYSGPVEVVPGAPRIAAYAQGRDYHRVLRGRLRRLGRWFDEREPGGAWRACVDSAPILEREFAQRAGLGWFGKNTCLIDSRRGSRFVLGMLLSTVPLEPDAPSQGGCGTCTACIDACPTGAIVSHRGRWTVDARRCISYLTIEHRGPLDDPSVLGGWTFGCDVCQDVCPFNAVRASQPERAPEASDPDLRARREWPALAELAQITDPEWDALTQGSAVRRARWDGLRRNAQANLDNT